METYPLSKHSGNVQVLVRMYQGRIVKDFKLEEEINMFLVVASLVPPGVYIFLPDYR
jgi:hypothetical protein